MTAIIKIIKPYHFIISSHWLKLDFLWPQMSLSVDNFNILSVKISAQLCFNLLQLTERKQNFVKKISISKNTKYVTYSFMYFPLIFDLDICVLHIDMNFYVHATFKVPVLKVTDACKIVKIKTKRTWYFEDYWPVSEQAWRASSWILEFFFDATIFWSLRCFVWMCLVTQLWITTDGMFQNSPVSCRTPVAVLYDENINRVHWRTLISKDAFLLHFSDKITIYFFFCFQ